MAGMGKASGVPGSTKGLRGTCLVVPEESPEESPRVSPEESPRVSPEVSTGVSEVALRGVLQVVSGECLSCPVLMRGIYSVESTGRETEVLPGSGSDRALRLCGGLVAFRRCSDFFPSGVCTELNRPVSLRGETGPWWFRAGLLEGLVECLLIQKAEGDRSQWMACCSG